MRMSRPLALSKGPICSMERIGLIKHRVTQKQHTRVESPDELAILNVRRVNCSRCSEFKVTMSPGAPTTHGANGARVVGHQQRTSLRRQDVGKRFEREPVVWPQRVQLWITSGGEPNNFARKREATKFDRLGVFVSTKTTNLPYQAVDDFGTG